jgi:TolB protein
MHRSIAILTVTFLLGLFAAWAQTPDAPDLPQQQPSVQADPQQGEVTLVLEGHQRPRLHLALPEFQGKTRMGREAAIAAGELEATLRRDLEDSRIFEIKDSRVLSVLELTGKRLRDFELYRSLGNEVVLLAEVKSGGDRLVLEGRIYDLKSGQSIVGKRYRGLYSQARRMAHTFADEVIFYFTARRGISLTSIAFYSDRDGFKELYLMDYDGGSQRRISAHKSVSMSPAWTPNGDGLAYVSFFNGPPAIYFVDLVTGRKRPVVTDGVFNTSPSFTPDGQRIAFSRSLGGNSEIYVCDRDGRNLRRLTHSAGIDTNPAWSPTGREIAFTSDRAGNPHVYVMDAEGTNLRRITFEGLYNDGADWSPDGTKLAYASRRRGGTNFKIAVSDLVTLEQQVLTRGPGSDETPTFSPDGRKIAFSSSRLGSHQIYVAELDGSYIRQLTDTGSNYGPTWSGYPEK